MNGISVHRVGINLLVVVEYDETPEGAGADDMAIRQDIAM